MHAGLTGRWKWVPYSPAKAWSERLFNVSSVYTWQISNLRDCLPIRGVPVKVPTSGSSSTTHQLCICLADTQHTLARRGTGQPPERTYNLMALAAVSWAYAGYIHHLLLARESGGSGEVAAAGIDNCICSAWTYAPHADNAHVFMMYQP